MLRSHVFSLLRRSVVTTLELSYAAECQVSLHELVLLVPHVCMWINGSKMSLKCDCGLKVILSQSRQIRTTLEFLLHNWMNGRTSPASPQGRKNEWGMFWALFHVCPVSSIAWMSSDVVNVLKCLMPYGKHNSSLKVCMNLKWASLYLLSSSVHLTVVLNSSLGTHSSAHFVHFLYLTDQIQFMQLSAKKLIV